MTHGPRPLDDNRINDDLRAELCQVFALGFLDRMAGFEVRDDDLIPYTPPPPDFATTLRTLALGCINHAQDMIAANIRENPQTIYNSVYEVGVEAFDRLERQVVSRN